MSEENRSPRQTRIARDVETREETQRAKEYVPPTALPHPTPQQGWRFRWIRTSMQGQPDNQNVSMKFREGWEPVPRSDVSKLGLSHLMPDRNSQFKDALEVGGLLLCKIPEEVVEQRTKYYAKMAKQQMDTVNDNYMSDNHENMRKFNQSSSKVTFGSGKP